ncbi:Oidioi.mRNA.OKI2018_I69.XSR.g15893.t1.cds [Oikopleura dioica]|uniref:Oidioi.mRNA.OKI2018_I69.XSR.g15893.t1.cds n=1 Tax=Oikopleura dioica TaxID=34765 RepID=A0ABN7SIA1_OIKDI|nr:Oidioi.mRNA.OKI2018_I69.XSR.g15893.t1.cds [Oikopleura dioica]
MKANTRWRKGVNTVGLFNFRGKRHNRPFTTMHQLNNTSKCKTDDELISYKFQLRYLYWLLENISERVKCRPPSTLERSRIDIDFPDYIHAEGCWNTFMTSGKRHMTRAHFNTIKNNESLIRQADVNINGLSVNQHVEPGSKKSVISMKEKLRSYDLTRLGRLRAKQEALNNVRSRTDYQIMKKMRSSASHFTEKTKKNEKEKAAGKWLLKIKDKFNNEQLDFLRCELEDLAHVKIPKSLSAQEDFFRTLRVLELHEIQDPEMKASIEFVRDMLCIDEISFDSWFEGRQLELTPSVDSDFPVSEL